MPEANTASWFKYLVASPPICYWPFIAGSSITSQLALPEYENYAIRLLMKQQRI